MATCLNSWSLTTMIKLVIMFLQVAGLIMANNENFCSKSKNQAHLYKRYPPDEKLNNYDQGDPELIEIVKKRMIPPALQCQDYNFSTPNVDLKEQLIEVEFLENEIFGLKTGGFFIEVGAYDGETISISLYFEKLRKWTGLLIEAQPYLYKKMLTKNRKAHLFGNCISTKQTPEIVSFDGAGPFGGIINGNRMPGDGFILDDHTHDHYFRRSKLTLQCFPIYTILMALGNPVVDFFILDIEGAEMPVLETIPWDKVNIKVIVVEVNHMGEIFHSTKEDLQDFMQKSGYTFFKEVDLNYVYIRNDFVPTKLE